MKQFISWAHFIFLVVVAAAKLFCCFFHSRSVELSPACICTLWMCHLVLITKILRQIEFNTKIHENEEIISSNLYKVIQCTHTYCFISTKYKIINEIYAYWLHSISVQPTILVWRAVTIVFVQNVVIITTLFVLLLLFSLHFLI